MTNAMDRYNAHGEDEIRYFSWLEDYLEQLAGEEAVGEFRRRHYDTPEYYELVAALMA